LKITLITVTYNAADHLRATFESVKAIKNDSIRYIVIDGCSTDGTVDLIKNYFGVVDTWLSEKDRGIYDAMNKGWLLADDDSWILFLGAGDTIQSLPEGDGYHRSDVIYGEVLLEKNVRFKSTVDLRLCLGNTLHHQALLVPKSVHLDTRFPTYADFDFNQRLYRSGVNFLFDQRLQSTVLPGGVSSTLNVAEMSEVCKKNFGSFAYLGSRLYLWYQGFKLILRK